VRDFSIAIFAVNVVLYAVVIARGHFPFDALGMAVLPDFIAHLTGGTLALHRDLAHLYDIDAQSNVQQAITHDPHFLDLYISPPLASLLYAPFARLPYALAAAAWTCVTLALLFLSARTIRTLTPSLPRSHRDVMLVAAMASQPVIQLLGSGQDTAISLLLWSSGVALALERRDAAAGLVMSLGLFKPQLFVLPPLMFLALRRKRAIGAWVTGALAQAALTLVVFGPSALQGWWRILQSPEYRVFRRRSGCWLVARRRSEPRRRRRDAVAVTPRRDARSARRAGRLGARLLCDAARLAAPVLLRHDAPRAPRRAPRRNSNDARRAGEGRSCCHLSADVDRRRARRPRERGVAVARGGRVLDGDSAVLSLARRADAKERSGSLAVGCP
jgi:hypothetical protein